MENITRPELLKVTKELKAKTLETLEGTSYKGTVTLKNNEVVLTLMNDYRSGKVQIILKPYEDIRSFLLKVNYERSTMRFQEAYGEVTIDDYNNSKYYPELVIDKAINEFDKSY